MFSALFVIVIITISFHQFLTLPKFGRIPEGERIQRILKSPNFKNGIFQNLNPTPQLTGESGFFKMFRDHFSAKNRRPIGIVSSQKTDLFSLKPNDETLVWFGHSSYFIQSGGKKFLVDPVFSGHASPLSFMLKAFNGTDVYTTSEIPVIDFLLITHDHWDHLDYKTIKALKSKIKTVVCPLGVGGHFEYWGFDKNQIVEKDWFEKVVLDDGFEINFTPARHFSGRGLKPKKTLWCSFVLQTPDQRIFIGGDGGYDYHFAEIGEQFGGFDLAILENGQFNANWKYIHMMPEETLLAAKDLKAKRLFPVHNSKFALANHPWNEPLKRISELCINENYALITPMIGQKVNLTDIEQEFSSWWERVE